MVHVHLQNGTVIRLRDLEQLADLMKLPTGKANPVAACEVLRPDFQFEKTTVVHIARHAVSHVESAR